MAFEVYAIIIFPVAGADIFMGIFLIWLSLKHKKMRKGCCVPTLDNTIFCCFWIISVIGLLGVLLTSVLLDYPLRPFLSPALVTGHIMAAELLCYLRFVVHKDWWSWAHIGITILASLLMFTGSLLLFYRLRDPLGQVLSVLACCTCQCWHIAFYGWCLFPPSSSWIKRRLLCAATWRVFWLLVMALLPVVLFKLAPSDSSPLLSLGLMVLSMISWVYPVVALVRSQCLPGATPSSASDEALRLRSRPGSAGTSGSVIGIGSDGGEA